LIFKFDYITEDDLLFESIHLPKVNFSVSIPIIIININKMKILLILMFIISISQTRRHRRHRKHKKKKEGIDWGGVYQNHLTTHYAVPIRHAP